MGDLIPLGERLEKWQTAWTSPNAGVRIRVSNHGGVKISWQTAKPCTLDFGEAVAMLRNVADAMDSAAKSMGLK